MVDILRDGYECHPELDLASAILRCLLLLGLLNGLYDGAGWCRINSYTTYVDCPNRAIYKFDDFKPGNVNPIIPRRLIGRL